MIRRVNYPKAILGGTAGALTWEALIRLLLLSGLPMFDIVHVLGNVLLGQVPAWQWWLLGISMHAGVGSIWAIFYAYFFWTEISVRPILQGAIFSLLPALLAGLIMVPQMGWMNPLVVAGRAANPGLFAFNTNGWIGPFTLVLGHVVYGLILGVIYQNPVGFPTGRQPKKWLAHAPSGADPIAHHSSGEAPMNQFIFATGIECSNPVIDHGRRRIDELDATEHYRYWRRDLELVRELGLHYLRYGPPLHRIFLGPGKYDWSFMDDVCRTMRELEIIPIMDLCHFGLPDWVGNFQNPEFPRFFAEYAAAFATRYPFVRFYTPVNEMYVTARMSTLDGAWNEQLQTEEAYVTATHHIAKACVLAMHEIEGLRPGVIFVNSESSEFFQPCCPDPQITRKADFENQRRFIALDLLFAQPLRADVFSHLMDHGMRREQYDWFMNQQVSRRIILGVDYYNSNEKMINSDGGVESLGELFGWYIITRQYYDRYKRPVMHAETNIGDAQEAPGWLWRQWHNIQLMRSSGVPVLGFTWYSLQDQVDWNVGITKAEGNVNPVGLFDLNRNARPVAQAYRQLLSLFGNEPLLAGTDLLQLH